MTALPVNAKCDPNKDMCDKFWPHGQLACNPPDRNRDGYTCRYTHDADGKKYAEARLPVNAKCDPNKDMCDKEYPGQQGLYRGGPLACNPPDTSRDGNTCRYTHDKNGKKYTETDRQIPLSLNATPIKLVHEHTHHHHHHHNRR